MYKISALYIAMVLWGYQITAFLLSWLVGDNTAVVTTPFRIFMLLWSMFLIVRSIGYGKQQDPALYQVNKRFSKAFIFFCVIYFIKVIWGVLLEPEKAGEFRGVVVNYMFFISIPYCCAFLCIRRFLDLDLVVKYSWRLAMIGILTFTCTNYSEVLGSFGRFSIGDGVQLLNPISLGQFGVTFVVLSYFYLNGKSKWLQLACYALGCLYVMKAGSRGPCVALIAVLFFIMWQRFRGKRWIPLVLLGSIGAFFTMILEVINSINPTIAMRFVKTVEDGDAARWDLVQEGFAEFCQHPLFGGYFMVPYRWYSHNVILDAFMGLGIIGGIYFLILTFFVMYRCIRTGPGPSALFCLAALWLQSFISRMTSGSFYMDTTFICLFYIVGSYALKNTDDEQDESSAVAVDNAGKMAVGKGDVSAG